MKQYGVVKSVDGDIAKVLVKRDSACAGCSSAHLCSAMCPNTTEAAAYNKIGAAVGDTVELETGTSAVLVYSMLTFIMPLVLGLIAYLAAVSMGCGETVTYIAAVCAALLSFIVLCGIVKLRGKRDLEVVVVRIMDNI